MADAKTALAAQQNKTNSVKKTDSPKNLLQWVEVMKPQITAALPSVITPERFSRIVMTAVSTTPQLANCEPRSFMGAMLQAAQLGVEPNTPLGQAYLIPYRNNRKGTVDCQFQLGAKGLITLAQRSGEFESIEARVVYENDTFEFEYGMESKLVHKPVLKDRGEAIAYYAVYHLKNGGFNFEVMSKEDVIAHRNRYSKAKNSPWDTAFDEMAKKTVLKKLLKYAPISVEFMRSVATDETVKTFNADDIDIIDAPNEMEYDDADVEVVEAEEVSAEKENK